MHTTDRPRRRRTAGSVEATVRLAEWRTRQARLIDSDIRLLTDWPRGGPR
ncbi:hypothetical protein HN031_02235 [Nocardioides sp. zg-1308]|uniref:Uncharacterized protein n=1 Tax=Nocardioides renjunii TaxID=3095075 RepID=A0ABU5K655_9ACTN|nr:MULTISPECIES: hypothetical protein [unclassified Nocardioides]MDZ5660392.1 hypothetical protein [Nocardioides sp. S-58]NPD03502.1 hypothetical protein [Nocardioides sp. zg-1308]